MCVSKGTLLSSLEVLFYLTLIVTIIVSIWYERKPRYRENQGTMKLNNDQLSQLVNIRAEIGT